MGAKEYRQGLGADILESMDKNEDLPLPNVHRLAKVMMEYFKNEGYIDGLTEQGYRWRPSEDYWRMHIQDIGAYLRQRRQKYFAFVREQGEFKGRWTFCSKEEYEATLAREYADVATRTETYNERLSDGNLRWKMQLPAIASVPLLTEKN